MVRLYRYKRTNQSYTEDLGEGVGLTLMRIPAGEFLMGAGADEPGGKDDERPQHLVKVPEFLMGRFPVTQAQWQEVAGWNEYKQERDLEPDPSSFTWYKLPVEQVSWDDAQEFCRRLSNKTGKRYGLPSEAQWEYACRAGTTTPFHFGAIITLELANYWIETSYNGNVVSRPRQETTEVGIFPANEWGLHDMHGNVWEWCEDDWHRSYKGAPIDSSAWVERDRKTLNRLLRGGCWDSSSGSCCSISRLSHAHNFRDDFIGFRVSCVLP